MQTQRFLLCLAVGVKQKKAVAMIVSRFSLRDFVIMLWHYDGRVGAWSDMPWYDAVLHVRGACLGGHPVSRARTD